MPELHRQEEVYVLDLGDDENRFSLDWMILKTRRSRLGPTSSWWPYYLPIDRLARVRDQVKVPAGVDEVNP